VKILFATHFFPFPPDLGGRIGYFNPLKYLSRQHEMVLFSLADKNDGPNIEAMRGICADVVAYCPATSGRWQRMVRGVVGDPPGTASKYFFPEAGELLRQTIRRLCPDIVELQHLNMAAYLPYCKGVPVILREHNVEYRVWERFAAVQESWHRKAFFEKLAARVRRYEGEMAERFGCCITVSEADARDLRTVAPRAEVLAIPSGVDAEYFVPDATAGEKPYSMVMTGSFNWKPKQHNLRVLAGEIFPLIKALVPEATLTIVGQGVPPDLKRVAEFCGVRVTGAVPDVRPYVYESALVLNYLESGGGIALKVLEAMAMRKPVLSNREGVEGIDAIVAGKHAAVADGREAFAEQAAELLLNPSRRARLAHEGHEMVQREYAWGQLARRFQQVYEELSSSRALTVAVGG